MKKLTILALVVVLSVAMCISVSAKTSLDRLTINNNTLATMPDDATNLRNTEEDIHINKGDKLFILGWAFGDEESNLKEVVYTIDGTEYKCADNYRDRVDVANAFKVDASLGTHAGIGKDDNAFELVGIDALDDGTYTLQIIAKFEDGTEEIVNDKIDEFTLVVGTGESAGNETQGEDNTEAVNFLDDGNGHIGYSLDVIFWNGAQVGDRGAVEKYFSEDGTLDGVALEGKSTGYHGWVCFNQEVKQFGYMINDKIVFDPAFKSGNEPGLVDTIRGWGGDWANGYPERYTITVPLEGLTGTNVVCGVVELADGTVVKLNDNDIHDQENRPFPDRQTTLTIVFGEDTQPATEPETVPQTGDVTVAMFAVIAVLAMGAAVVFMKKRAF